MGIGAFIYYYTTLRKIGRQPGNSRPGVSLGKRQAPPVNVSDFYKGRRW